MGGGGGPEGVQRYEWSEAIAPYWSQALGMGNYYTGLGVNGTPGAPTSQYQQYPYERVADLQDDHWNALQNIRNTVASGAPDTNAARAQSAATTGGAYLTGPGANPYAGAENKFQGTDNPYFRSLHQAGLEDIGSVYRDVTAPDLAGQMVLNGTLGGGAHEQLRSRNEGNLAKQLTQYSTGMFNDQYNRSAGLDEARLNRGSGAFEGERGRMVGTIGAGQAGQGLDFDRYGQLMNAGNVLRGREQQYMDQGYQDWQDQRDYGWNQLTRMAGLLGTAQGGLPPNTFTQQTGGSNPWGNALGTALSAYGMFRG